MAGESIIDYAGQAAIAYQDALNQARNTQNALLRQYGFTAPGVGGDYSVEGAQAAFDPNSLFDKATGGVDKARLAQLAGGLQVGGTGLLADLMRQGATSEADVVAEARSRGFGGEIGGGLLSQRRQLAEAQTAGQVGSAKEQFLAGIGQALSPIGGAYQELQNARIMDQYAMAAADAAQSALPGEVNLGEAAPSAAEGRPRLSAGPQGEFMSKFKAAFGAGARPSHRISAFKDLYNNYALTSQQQSRVKAELKKLGVSV